jgi:Ca2+-binding RTX toxin-like protein
MKRRALLLMVTMAAALLVAGGVALAETVTCDNNPPCYGTPETDDITGTDFGEKIYAYGGNDTVLARGGNDTVYGSSGNDPDLEGEGGSDTVYGGGGADSVDVGASDTPGSTDHAFGGGNDALFAADDKVDIIDCGKGVDSVQYDQGIDTTRGCENKQGL